MTATPPSVPLPESAFRVPPPEPPRKPASPALIIACSLLALAVMAVVGTPLIKRFLAARAHSRVMADLGADRSDLYTRQRRDYLSDPVRVQTKVALDLGNALRRRAPDATFSVSERAAIDDEGPALRMAVEYRGSVPEAGGHLTSVRGHVREYVHPYGLVTLESACFTDYSMCLRYDELVAAADRAILEHIGDGDLEQVIPAEADCEKKQTDIGAHARILVTCRFEGNISLTFQRFGLGAANMEFAWRSQDPGDRPMRKPQD
jgi:hypothetical protein